ncbi:DUF421 domain-containing protein [Enterococcus sp. LJL120]
MSIFSPVIIKLALGLICLILQINIFGKGNLAPASAVDQVQNYVLGGIIGGVIYNDQITILQFVLVLVVWTTLVLSLKFGKEHNRYIKNFVDGRPTIVITNGTIDVEACLRHGISANDLMFKLRNDGVYQISKIKRAILEQNGQLTVIEQGDPNAKYPIIADGQINLDVLEIIGKDSDWLAKEVSELAGKSIDQIYLGEYVSGQLKLYEY